MARIEQVTPALRRPLARLLNDAFSTYPEVASVTSLRESVFDGDISEQTFGAHVSVMPGRRSWHEQFEDMDLVEAFRVSQPWGNGRPRVEAAYFVQALGQRTTASVYVPTATARSFCEVYKVAEPAPARQAIQAFAAEVLSRCVDQSLPPVDPSQVASANELLADLQQAARLHGFFSVSLQA
ncbi:MAG TPA: hypothetical protein VIM53_03425 [Candidatus Saccharimonadales bacterium]